MPFKLPRLKKRSRQQYNVASKALFVITVELLDNAQLECTLTADSTGRDCLANVCQRLGLSQVELFGLRFVCRRSYPKIRWLDLDRPLQRQLDKHAQENYLYLGVMFYVHDVSLLEDETTRYHYFMQLRLDVLEGRLRCNYEQAIVLASYSLQAELGDHEEDKHSVEWLMQTNWPLLPKPMLAQFPQDKIATLINAVVTQHASLRGIAQQLAEVYYIVGAQQLDGYGQECFLAKDEQGSEVLIGASLNGIVVRKGNGQSPQFFRWNDITNLVNHKRVFGIECQNFECSAQFLLDEPDSAKYVWKMCVLQHTFYKMHAQATDNNELNITLDQQQQSSSNGSQQFNQPVTMYHRGNSFPSYCSGSSSLVQQQSELAHFHLRQTQNIDLTTMNLPQLSPWIIDNNNFINNNNDTYNIAYHLQQQPQYQQVVQRPAPDYETAIRTKYGDMAAKMLTQHQLQQQQVYDLNAFVEVSPDQQLSEQLHQQQHFHNSNSNIVFQQQAQQPLLVDAMHQQQQEQQQFQQQQQMQQQQLQQQQHLQHQLQQQIQQQQLQQQQLEQQRAARLQPMQGFAVQSHGDLLNYASTPDLNTYAAQSVGNPNLVVGSSLTQDEIVAELRRLNLYKAPPPYPSHLHRLASNSTPDLPNSTSPTLGSKRHCSAIDIHRRRTSDISEPIYQNQRQLQMQISHESQDDNNNAQSPQIEECVQKGLEPIYQNLPAHQEGFVGDSSNNDDMDEVCVVDDTVDSAGPLQDAIANDRRFVSNVNIVHHEHSSSTNTVVVNVSNEEEDDKVNEEERKSFKNNKGTEKTKGEETNNNNATGIHVKSDGNSKDSSKAKTSAKASSKGLSGSNTVEKSQKSEFTPKSSRKETLIDNGTENSSPKESKVKSEDNLESSSAMDSWSKSKPRAGRKRWALNFGSKTGSLKSIKSENGTIKSATHSSSVGRAFGPLMLATLHGLTRSRPDLLAESLSSPDFLPKSSSLHSSLSKKPLDDSVSGSLSAANSESLCSSLEQKLVEGDVVLEFERIPKKKVGNCDFSTAILAENVVRNRFRDVLPYEENRVRLNEHKDNKLGYINASHITMTVGEEQRFYIAAQGPLPNTVNDFWQLIVQNDVRLVVMCTSASDSSSSCPYWPTKSGSTLELGSFRVTKTYNRSNKFYTTSTLRVFYQLDKGRNGSSRGSVKVRDIWHLHYSDWSRNGCPGDVNGFIEFLEEMSALRGHVADHVADHVSGHVTNRPVLVHCSAGVGRTGVAILCDILLHCIDHNRPIDIPRLLTRLRQQRMLMVQTVAQYKFVHTVLISYMKQSRLI